jgi:DNA adenine methylase
MIEKNENNENREILDLFEECFTVPKAKSSNNRTKSLIKWAGGKSGIISQIVPDFLNRDLLKDGGCYFEPFAGSCTLALYLNYENMVLNDKNIKLINFFRQVKDKPGKLVKKINTVVDSYVKSDSKSKFYNELREKYNCTVLSKGNGIVHAAMFWFLNKTGFNGMYRETSSGDFNIPFGKRKCPVPDLNHFLEVSDILRKCRLYSHNYKIVCDMAKEGDIVYLDPPYIPISDTSGFSDYLRYGFNLKDHENLYRIMEKMDQKGVYVVMSNSSS